MRILEIVLLVIITSIPFIKRPVLKNIKKKTIVVILLGILSMHIILEGWRWQMIPAYILLCILLWRIYVVKEIMPIKLTFIRIAGYLVFIIILIPSWILPMMLPVFSLPKPTGVYKVGTRSIHIKTTMDEPITEDTTDQRELMVKVWYPAKNNTSSKQEPYLDTANRTSFIQK